MTRIESLLDLIESDIESLAKYAHINQPVCAFNQVDDRRASSCFKLERNLSLHPQSTGLIVAFALIIDF